MELDLQSLFGLHMHSWTVLIGLRPRNPTSSLHIWAHVRGRYGSAKIYDISLWPSALPKPAYNCEYIVSYTELGKTPLMQHKRIALQKHTRIAFYTNTLFVTRIINNLYWLSQMQFCLVQIQYLPGTSKVLHGTSRSLILLVTRALIHM